MGLPYIKTDIIGVDLYRLACKDQVSFTCYWLLVSHCFEHAIVSIPLDILDEKLCDITDNVDNVLKVLKLRSLITYDDNNCIVLNGIKERILNGIEAIDNKTNRNKRYYEKNKVKNNEESKNIEQDTNNERYNNKHPLAIKWDKISEISYVQLKTSSAWLYNNKFSWDENTVLSAIDFLSINKDKLSNRIMCDWHQDGFFIPGYKFDIKTINEHFEKKGKKFIVNKNDCGTGTVYPEEYKTKTKDPNLLIVSNSVRKAIHKKTEEEMDKEMLEQIGGEI